MEKDTHVYPAMFVYADDGIHVTFPDLPGCVTFGETQERAAVAAKEALALHLCGMEEDGDAFPAASQVRDIPHDEGEALVLIETYLPLMRAKLKNQYDKKTLTVPHWLNLQAEREGINFSQTLQEGLMAKLGISPGQ